MKKFILFVFVTMIISCTILAAKGTSHPVPIKRINVVDKNGVRFTQTEIYFDKNTSREDVIGTCSFLAKENIQLIFDKLEIRPSFLGITGRNRIAYVKGRIELPDGSIELFKAGSMLAFRSVKITFSKREDDNSYFINMVEIID